MNRALSLIDFARLYASENQKQWNSLPYLKTIQAVLYDAMRTGRNKILALPPRHYKTTFACQLWPAWSLVYVPDCKFIIVSATKELAADNVQAIRTILECGIIEQISGYSLRSKKSQTQRRRDYIKTEYFGLAYGIGLGTQITGYAAGGSRRGYAGALLLDDPLKTQEAYSKAARDRCLKYFTQSAFSRRETSDTPIILVSQRLHQNDLIGELLRREPDKWDLVKIPARMPDGTLSNPFALDGASLDRIEKLDPFTYAAQYQQEPEGDASQVVDVTKFSKFSGELSKIGGRFFLTIDSAMSTNEYADRSVISRWCANMDGLYHLGCTWGRWDFIQLLDETRAAYQKMRDEGRSCEIYVEDRVSGTSLHQTLRDELRIRPWLPKEYRFPESKQARVQHSLPMLYGGKCLFTERTPPELYEEFHWFRNDISHDHDDFVDSVTMACSLWLYWGGKVI